MKPTSKIRDHVIIFDLDGVIVDSVDPCQRLFYTICERELGLFHKPSFGREMMSLTREQIIPLEWGEEIRKQNISPQKIEDTIARYRKEKMALDLPLLPGVRDLFFSIYACFEHIAVVSNNPIAVIQTILKKVGLLSLVQRIVGMEEIVFPKPDPAMYRCAADYFRMDPDFCLVFEDSKSGVMAAQAAGMNLVAIATGTDSASDLQMLNPDLTLNNLTEFSLEMIFDLLGIPHPTPL